MIQGFSPAGAQPAHRTVSNPNERPTQLSGQPVLPVAHVFGYHELMEHHARRKGHPDLEFLK